MWWGRKQWKGTIREPEMGTVGGCRCCLSVDKNKGLVGNQRHEDTDKTASKEAWIMNCRKRCCDEHCNRAQQKLKGVSLQNPSHTPDSASTHTHTMHNHIRAQRMSPTKSEKLIWSQRTSPCVLQYRSPLNKSTHFSGLMTAFTVLVQPWNTHFDVCYFHGLMDR